jgi:hypothetical protein
VATRIYLLPINHFRGLIGPTKINPHFLNGSFSKIIIILAKFFMANPLILWHASQDLENSEAS